MEQKPCQIGIFCFQIQLIRGPPGLKERVPGRPNGNVDVLVQIILFVLFIGLLCAITQQTLANLPNIPQLIQALRNGHFIELVQRLLLRHGYMMDEAVLQELLHDATLHDITNKKKGRISLEGPLGLEVLQELLETPLLSLR